MRPALRFIALAALSGALACAGSSGRTPAPAKSAPPLETTLPPVTPELRAQAAARIRHIVVIMQENRSFDEYFGT